MTVSELNQARGALYRLLSSLFAREIDQERLRSLTSNEGLAFWDYLASDPELTSPTSVLVSTLCSLESQADLLELAADYCGLFLVGGKNAAPPYAGHYLGQAPQGEPLLFGRHHQQMVRFLQQSGMAVDGDFPEPADHIAVVLAYLAHRCQQSTAQEQVALTEQILSPWLDPFVQRVEQCDPGGFYSALARLTQSWVNSDLAWLRSQR